MSNTTDIIDEGSDSHEDDLNQLLFKTVQAQLKVKSTNNNDTSFESTNNAASTSSPSLLPRRIQLLANHTEFGDFYFFLETVKKTAHTLKHTINIKKSLFFA